jgi:hypothetical protein
VADLLARMSSVELSEWQQYAGLRGGLRDRRLEVQSAQLCALLANVHRKKGAPAFRIADFLPPEPEAEPARRQPMSGLASLLRNTAKD